ncbi:uncharacterized protein LAJ45_07073 [Morchella importuna]|nr:uncharacterized protein LAJ45_07073 [Morchella importuna]KAH8148730.1 hypothetical protein LAJ45_07073 [Morchella importuna]
MDSETSTPSSSHSSSSLHFTPPDTDVEMESLTAPTAVHTDTGTDPRLENEEKVDTRQFTTRAVGVGLLVGTIVNFSNMYFGLQTGWVSMMSMPSSLIGFALFKTFSAHLSYPFTPTENVLVQTVAVAVGSMPLSAGFVGVIPALETLLLPSEGGPLHISIPKLILWSIGVAFFGVFFAVPLRRQVIVKEKLPFPSGTATALMIAVLHGKDTRNLVASSSSPSTEPERPPSTEDHARSWKSKTRLLGGAFCVSAAYTLASYFVPVLRNLPVFGRGLATHWLWALNPSPAYVGQGIIMGTSTTLHMLLGAVVGWGVLSPLAKHNGWAPGPVDDWAKGSRGWIVWVSLAIMLSDSVISLGGLVLEPAVRAVMAMRRRGDGGSGSYQRLLQGGDEGEDGAQNSSYESVAGTLHHRRPRKPHHDPAEEEEPEDLPPSHLVSNKTVIIGLFLSGLLCIFSTTLVFPTVPLPATLIAFTLALLLSIMGVRALGQTDLNPVSGISKLTQLLFALITPNVLTNLVAGAISEAGAQQAGDIMQDLKTGYLLRASPRAQFHGQLIGSVAGAVVSAVVYRLYTTVYPVPGELFQVPTAYVWVDCARLVSGEGLPKGAWTAACIAAAAGAAATLARGWGLKGSRWREWVPGGIAVAVGMYNVPSFTLARAVGGGVAWWWKGEETTLVILASGLILGEGVASVVSLAMASVGVPHL